MFFKSLSSIWKTLIPITAFIILLILNPHYLKKSDSPSSNQRLYSVSRIVDGDTIRVIIEDREEVVRLVNINAPESVDPRESVECMGEEASEIMSQLVYGKKVRLEEDRSQSSRDRYQRLLRFVFLEDGTDVGLEMIRLGYAYSTPYGSSAHKYLDEYELAQEEAIKSKRGLWDLAACSDQDQPNSE